MITIRSRIPALLSDLMFRGVSITFSNSVLEPMISWKYENGGSGHAHLTKMVDGVYGANAIEMEHVLVMILAELPNPPEARDE